MSIAQRARLIAVDCDGTLFDGSGQPSSRTCEVMQRLVDTKHQIVAVTGRSRLSACKRIGSVPGMRHAVCANGAYAWDMHEDQLVWDCELTQTVVTDIVSRLRNAFPDAAFGWETRDGVGFDDTFIELAGGIDEVELIGQAGDPWSQGLYKLAVRRPSVFRLELQQEVASVLGDTLCEITTSGPPFVEISAMGSNKGVGIEKTASLLGFSAADTIAFGDNHNDIPMFRWAGHAVAMGNAVDAVQAESHAVTLPNTEDGVAQYLEQLLDAGTL